MRSIFKFILFIYYLNVIFCQVNIKVKLYKSDNPNESFNIIEDTELDKLDGFCNSHYTNGCMNYIITHGFLADGESDWIKEMKNELLKFEKNANIFVMDWSNGSMTGMLGYEKAVQNVQYTAIAAAKLFSSLSKYFQNSNGLINVHCIGHSLGSHVCGVTGKLMKKLNLKFKRITGLDPAGPCFEGYAEQHRLHIEDADYVDVIHTSKTLGYDNPIGHSDFYPNQGTTQPGCYLRNSYNQRNILPKIKFCQREIDLNTINDTIFDSFNSNVSSRFLSELSIYNLFFSCSHGRAYKFFIESIKSLCGFSSDECKNYANFEKGQCKRCASNSMGIYSRKTEKPTYYYLKTFSNFPFCIPKKRTEICVNNAKNINNNFFNIFSLILLNYLIFTK